VIVILIYHRHKPVDLKLQNVVVVYLDCSETVLGRIEMELEAM
jgi:hypothetical protein